MINKNHILNDTTISYKAKGIYFYLYNSPTMTGMSQKKLKTCSTDGLASIRSGLHELINHSYLACHKQGDGSVQWQLI